MTENRFLGVGVEIRYFLVENGKIRGFLQIRQERCGDPRRSVHIRISEIRLVHPYRIARYILVFQCIQNPRLRKFRIEGNKRRDVLHDVSEPFAVHSAPRLPERKLAFEPDICLQIEIFVGRFSPKNFRHPHVLRQHFRKALFKVCRRNVFFCRRYAVRIRAFRSHSKTKFPFFPFAEIDFVAQRAAIIILKSRADGDEFFRLHAAGTGKSVVADKGIFRYGVGIGFFGCRKI